MLEIERKFLIERPEDGCLSDYKFSDIVQTYLLPKGRVRMRKYEDRTVYTHTVKTSVTNITRIEEERCIQSWGHTFESNQASTSPIPAEQKLVSQTLGSMSKGAPQPKLARRAATLVGIS